uniref:ELKS/Rab6-interacting/CAST family member 1-like isoform X2 n=1 Tax=Myxine glutinosa TaxID=7769 RepID=UPI00358F4406
MYGSSRSVGGERASDFGAGRSPRLPRSPRLGHRRTNSSGGGKTMSMENIQSLNAAYTACGPLYLEEQESASPNPAPGHPKSTMTLGRPMMGCVPVTTRRTPYSLRSSATGSSPNITSIGLPGGDAIAFGEMDAVFSPVCGLQLGASHDAGLDVHVQLQEMHRVNELLRRELEMKDSKLSSSMGSIKSFWSPELKKERSLRKEEVARNAVTKQQTQVLQEENQHLQLTIQAMQEELRTQRDLDELLQGHEGLLGSTAGLADECFASAEEDNNAERSPEAFRRLRAQHERQAKELFLLRRTLEEMELRIDVQKQTLCARDESIRKLMEMLQGKGMRLVHSGSEDERLTEAEAQLAQLQSVLDGRERENLQLREEIQRRAEATSDTAKSKALQTVVEMKDTKITCLEQNLRELEDEIQMLKTNGALSVEEREEEMKQMEVYKSHSKFMKTKVDQVRQELSRKESELLALQTKLDTLTNQNSDCKQHIEVLKESLTAKEQRAIILQTEVDALRQRLEEKEALLNKKSKQLQELAEEKGTLGSEIGDLKDMLDVKERKINILQKKIENLQEQVKDKEKQVGSLKDRIKSLQADSSNTDTALATLEEALTEKEHIIERLKEQRDRDDRDRQEEGDTYKKENKELKEKIKVLQNELTDKESSLLDIKEHASSLASSGLKKDSKLKTMEITLEHKTEECSKLESHLRKSQEAEEVARSSPELGERVRELECELTLARQEVARSQAEVDRLLDILREVENEKHDKDKKIAELEGHQKDNSKKMANLKHKEHVEKKKSAQMLEEARKREDNLSDGSQALQDSLRQRDERIEELEDALRESVQITADREMVLAQQEANHATLQKQLTETTNMLEKTRQEVEMAQVKLSSMQQSLAEKEAHLTNLRAERRRQLEEVLEMKQEALLAAISEKDANIALLELSSSKKKKTQEEVAALKREKDRLVQQLKQQTQNRMKLMADSYEDDRGNPNSCSAKGSQQPSPDQAKRELLEVHHNRARLRLYVAHLTNLCHEHGPDILHDCPGITSGDMGSIGVDDKRNHENEEEEDLEWENRVRNLSPAQVAEELAREERAAEEMQSRADALLQCISDQRPDLLELVVNALEEVAV